MNYTGDTLTKGPFTAKLVYDEDPLNPRTDWDPFGHLICWDRNRNIGDKHQHKGAEQFLLSLLPTEVCDRLEARFKHEDDKEYAMFNERNWGSDDIHKYYKENESAQLCYRRRLAAAVEKGCVILSVYHSGRSGISAGAMCWPDEDGAGFTYATRAEIFKEYGGKVLTKKKREQAVKLLTAECETYSQWAEGDVYGYVIEHENGDEVDGGSCWGFYGIKYAKEEMKSMLECVFKDWDAALEEGLRC